MTLTRTLAAACVLLLALLVAACTGSPEAPTPTTTVTGEPTTATSTAPPTEGTPTPGTGEAVASTAHIPTGELPLVRFTSTDGEAVTLPVEVISRAEFPVGLSGRTELEGRGMLFFWPEGDSNAPFWMRNTHIDLDIAFVDASLRIIAITAMEAEADTLHYAPAPYLAAIEAPLGWYAEHGVDVGATVEFLFDPDALGAGR